MKGIETLSYPGAEERGKSHASLAAFRTASTTADLASNDQWTYTALRQIVVGWDSRHRHEDKEFQQKETIPRIMHRRCTPPKAIKREAGGLRAPLGRGTRPFLAESLSSSAGSLGEKAAELSGVAPFRLWL